ncbi:MAG: hypothetical protein R6X09_08420 [Bacteroidales bacterium]
MKRFQISAFMAFAFWGLVAVALLTGCNKSDIDDLEDRVAALEKSTSVIGVEFTDSQMVITYSDNKTETLEFEDGLSGLELLNSDGIASIDYSETTKVLTINLTNGNVSEFRIYGDTYAGLVAVLISDVNGKMYISQVNMGAAPIISVEYDEDFNITNLHSKIIREGQILDFLDVTKQYTGGALTGLQVSEYAMERGTSYDSEYMPSIDTIRVDNIGNYAVQNPGDTTFRYYQFSYTSGSNYHYNIHPHAIKRFYATGVSYPSYFYAAQNADTAYRFEQIRAQSVTGGYDVWYRVYNTYILENTYEVGDIAYTETFSMECNASGNPEKVYPDDDYYIQMTYNPMDQVTKGEAYYKDGDTWTKEDEYLTFEYNTDNQLSTVTFHTIESDTVVFKTVYDDNGNPVEIWAWSDEVTYWYDYFDPWNNPEDPWQDGEEVLVEEGLQLMATIEYEYSYKNFFGNTLGALIPVLDKYKLYNAPSKISYAKENIYGSLTYSNFNESGYPETVVANLYGMFGIRKSTSENYSIELGLEYIVR